MKTKKLHLLLVGLQFGGIFFFVFTGKVYPQSWLVALLLSISLFVGLWAILSMNSQTLTVLPDARPNATLITTGPYRWIRHPMYTAVLLLLTALLLNEFSFVRMLVLAVVAVALILKINIKEKILLAKYLEYSDYMKTTRKIIPYLF